MAELTAERLKTLFKEDPMGVSKDLAGSLRGFGYDVTPEWVKGEIQRLLKGETPRGGPSMFLDRWLRDGIH